MEISKISIIIPYKNAAEYIPRCVDSLKGQSGRFEVLFVDDGSEDDGPEQLSKALAGPLAWKHDRQAISLENEQHPGVGGARNTGITYANGDWITFLDIDDELLPGAWDKYTQMINGADADIHQANHTRYNRKTGALVRKYDNPSGTYYTPALPEMWAPVWNKLYKSELIKDIRFPDLRFGEDEMFNILCLEKAGCIHNTAVDTVRHNLGNPASLSRTKGPADLKNLLQALVEELPFADTPQMKRAIYNTIIQHMEAGWFQKIICGE